MSGNDAGELLAVTQADRDAVQAFHRTMLDRMMSDVKSQRPKLGDDEGDAGTLVQAFARHRLSTTPASAGVLVEALRAQMDAQDDSLPDSVARRQGLVWLEGWFDINAALSTTATPASDGVSPETFTWPEPKFLPVDGGQKLNPARVQAAFDLINQELVIGEQFQLIEMMLDGTEYTVSEFPTPDRFGEGYRAGVDLPTDKYGETAMDRLTDHAENGTMPPQFREDLRAVLGLAIRALQPATGDEALIRDNSSDLAHIRGDMKLSPSEGEA